MTGKDLTTVTEDFKKASKMGDKKSLQEMYPVIILRQIVE